MTIYYQCDACGKTSPDHKLFWTDKEKSRPLCPHCWGFVSYAFSVCTADQPEPSIGFCDGCDELEAKLHLMDGDWLCDICKAAVIKTQEDKVKAKGYWCEATGEQIEPQDVEPYGHPQHGWIDVCPCHHLELVREKPAPRETKLLREELQDLEKGCTDHWEGVKARVFIALFVVWVCFAVWGKYNA